MHEPPHRVPECQVSQMWRGRASLDVGMGEVNRKPVALLAACAALFAWPAAAAADPPVCPTELTVDVSSTVVVACSDADGDEVTYPMAPQPAHGTIAAGDGG